MQLSQEYDTAGPLDVEVIDACVEDARQQFEDEGGEQIEMTKRDEFAALTGRLIGLAIGKVVAGAEPSDVDHNLSVLVNDNLGDGPASLGYLLADLAEIMLHDSLDQIPVIETL